MTDKFVQNSLDELTHVQTATLSHLTRVLLLSETDLNRAWLRIGDDV